MVKRMLIALVAGVALSCLTPVDEVSAAERVAKRGAPHASAKKRVSPRKKSAQKPGRTKAGAPKKRSGIGRSASRRAKAH